MFSARLIRQGWLLRLIEVSLPDGTHLLIYNGRGVGYEQVSADGQLVRERSLIWFVPRFELKVGGYRTLLEVRVWPWLAIRSLVLRVGDQIVYVEGVRHREQKPQPQGEWAELA